MSEPIPKEIVQNHLTGFPTNGTMKISKKFWKVLPYEGPKFPTGCIPFASS